MGTSISRPALLLMIASGSGPKAVTRIGRSRSEFGDQLRSPYVVCVSAIYSPNVKSKPISTAAISQPQNTIPRRVSSS